MKINSVKFKDKKSFEKNKKKSNVLAVHEPFNIIVFKDEEDVVPDTAKVSQTNTVDASLDQISTGLAILIANDYTQALAYLKSANVVVAESFELTKTFFVQVPDFAPFDSFYDLLMSTGLFISVEPDYIMPMEATEEMTYTGHWHLPNMKCQEAWDILPAGSVKEVAVLDIACETNHEDLAGRISSTSWNCVTDGPDVNPVSEFEKHGTACAGVICANTGNGIGCKSISNNHLKVQFLHIGYNSTSGGSFMTSDTIITRAVNKAVANPDCVAMSMSWGSTGSGYPLFSNALTMAKTTARNGKGIPLFASSGNSYQADFTQLPASYASVMAVGASTSTNTRASFSNYGPKLFAAAPGTSLYTTDRSGAAGYGPESYRGFSGTSASCPAMAAVAGCVLVKNPDLTELQVRDILKNSCRKVGGYVYTDGKSAELGWGVIDMYTAVLLAGGTDPGDPTPTPGYNIFGTISTPSSVEQGKSVNVTYSVVVDKVLTQDLVVPVSIAFKRTDGSSLNFYTGTVTISAGQTSKSMNIPYTVPNTVTGICQFVLTVDSSNQHQETNETDNIALTSINVTQISVPVGGADGEIKINSYEWLDSSRVRIWYTITNKGTVNITSWKATVGFDGRSTVTWNRADFIAPGRSLRMGSVFPSSMYGTLPNTFRITITQVNGAADVNPANNSSSMLINPFV
jgi:hypothetical protein